MPNAFETGSRKAIPAVLIYVRRGDDVLMIHRDSGRPGDYHAGKWNGLGGKCEPDESPLEAARRELHEESGIALDASAFQALGVIQFPNFKPHKKEDWIVFVFAADAPASASLQAGAEGSLHWVPTAKLAELNLWAGDRHFIPLVSARRKFMGTIWYEGETVLRHWIEVLD